MMLEATERRRHSRDGLFGLIEDVTYRVLRRTGTDFNRAESGELVEYQGNAEIPSVNVTFGLSAGEQLGEPF